MNSLFSYFFNWLLKLNKAIAKLVIKMYLLYFVSLLWKDIKQTYFLLKAGQLQHTDI